MGKKRWIDKKSATTFTLVHRPQNDPLIHDESASSMVFQAVKPGNEKAPQDKIKTTHDLEEELGTSITSHIRDNEGEAAQFGVYYDDTEYDYMQHMRDIGVSSEAVFVEAPQTSSKQRKKQPKLEDALRSAPGPEDLLPRDLLPNENLVRRSYQDQQDVPDALAGFQPDMDPRLREVLEALEDEAFVDDDEDLFGALTKGADVLDEDEFYEQQEEFDVYGDGNGHGEDDEGWATDDTERPTKKQSKKQSSAPPPPEKSVTFSSAPAPPHSSHDAPPEASEDWMSEFSKFKRAQKSSIKKNAAPASEIASSIGEMSSIGGLSGIYSLGGSKSRRRRKKAATESGSLYSMSSSVLSRTEGQTLLDQRFEKIETLYEDSDEEDDDQSGDIGNSLASVPKSKQAPPEGFKESRQDFNSIMDEFLDNYSVTGKYGKRVKKGKQQTGLEQLDEVRMGLGRARIPGR